MLVPKSQAVIEWEREVEADYARLAQHGRTWRDRRFGRRMLRSWRRIHGWS